MAETKQEDPSQEEPPFKFSEVIELYGDEEGALSMLETLTMSLSSEQQLVKLLDAILYEDFHEIKELGHKLKGVAGYAMAHHMSEIAKKVQDAGIHNDKETAVTQMKELIKETCRVHIHAMELNKVPQEDIQSQIQSQYEILQIYTQDNEGKDHYDKQKLIEHWDDEGIANMMFENGLNQTFCEENFFEKYYVDILEQDYANLANDAHMMKGRARLLYLPKLIEVCAKLQKSAQTEEKNDVECCKYLIDVIDESFFMERFLMIKKLESGEPTQKLINLNPELTKLLANRDNVEGIFPELKEGYPAYKASKGTSEEKKEEENAEIQPETKEPETSNAVEETKTSEEIKLSPPLEDHKEHPHSEEAKLAHAPTFHETSVKTVLEVIPEEREREETKQSETVEDEGKFRYPREKSPDSARSKNLPQELNLPTSVSEEDVKLDHNLSMLKTKSKVLGDLAEIEENKEEGIESPANLTRSNAPAVPAAPKEEIIENHIVLLKKEDSIVQPHNAPVVVVTSKKKKVREERNIDDDYPFDSGLKCNLI